MHKCDICDQEFNRPNEVKSHEESVHEGVKKFECNHCNKKYSAKKSLNRHLKEIGKIKNHNCEVCNKAFFHKKHLMSHIKFVPEKPKDKIHNCRSCDKKLPKKIFGQETS